jgi:VIT1/CCC1 family predicted Fe2+/Mn2+ transporter
MEIILDILFDLIVEGSIGAVGDKKVPLALRILAAVFLTVIFGGLVGVLVYIGIDEKNWIILIIGVVIALAVIGAVWQTVRKHRK